MNAERPIVGLVACCAKKLGRAAPARLLYQSALFRLSLAVAERTCTAVFVVSARHHLVELDRVVHPYDFTMADVGGKKDRARWGAHVATSLTSRFGLSFDTVFYAGQEYAGPIADHLRTCRGFHEGRWWGIDGQLRAPMRGMMIGERLSWLRAQLGMVEVPHAG